MTIDIEPSVISEGNYAAVSTAPFPATEIDLGVTGVLNYIAVTEEHGLQQTTVDVREYLPRPSRAAGRRQVSEVVSFLEELDRRPLTTESTLWGDYNTGTVTAVYNDHGDIAGGWRDDLLTLQLIPDPDWAAWTAMSGKFYSQTEFSDRLEELIHTVISPDQADLEEIVRDLRAHKTAVFESRSDPSVSTQSVTYTEEVRASAGTATRQLEVPRTITLRLRPWEGHIDTYDIDAWFRIDTEGGRLTLAIKLTPVQQLLRKAWADLTAQIVAAAETPVYAYRGTR